MKIDIINYKSDKYDLEIKMIFGTKRLLIIYF